MKTEIIIGDSFEEIKKLADNSVDLVLTSPPYADILSYGKNVSTKKPDDYVDWILPLFKEIVRVLKPSGSFILNIGDKCEGGLRSTYVFDLVSRTAKETKLKLYDTYFWYKKNGIPNGGSKRVRNNTEYIFHYCKDPKKLKFNMKNVMEEPKESSTERYKHEMTDQQGVVIDGVRVRKKVLFRQSKTQKEDGTSESVYVYKDAPEKVRPDNVRRFPTASASRDNTIKHPAPFHKELPLYYIKMLTDVGDIVVDTFSGIGTTGIACKELDRNYIGFEMNEIYAKFSRERIQNHSK